MSFRAPTVLRVLAPAAVLAALALAGCGKSRDPQAQAAEQWLSERIDKTHRNAEQVRGYVFFLAIDHHGG